MDFCPVTYGDLSNLQNYMNTTITGTFLTALLSALSASRCGFSHLDTFPPNSAANLFDGYTVDYIVVGSGASGSVLAARLAENSTRSVLLLEAGGYPNHDNDVPAFYNFLQTPDFDYMYTSEPNNYSCQGMRDQRCPISRGHVLGGSNSIDAPLYLRGYPFDFDVGQTLVGLTNWGMTQVLPYFLRSQNLTYPFYQNANTYGTNGPLTLTLYNAVSDLRDALIDSAKRLGYSIGLTATGHGLSQSLTINRNGMRLSAARAYLSPNANRSNLILSLNARVSRVIFNGTRAAGVIADVNGRNLTLRANREVILSAGAINSPVILQQSGIGDPQVLQSLNIPLVQAVPQVGRNLQDQISNFAVLVQMDPGFIHFDDLPDQYYRFLRYRTGRFTNVGITNMQLFVGPPNQPAEMAIYFFEYQPNSRWFNATQRAQRYNDQVLNSMLQANSRSRIVTMAVTLLRPLSSGNVSLVRQADGSLATRIYPNYFSNDTDVATFLRGMDVVFDLLGTPAFRMLNASLLQFTTGNCDNYDFWSREFWMCHARNFGFGLWNPRGTCRAGNNATMSVVDGNLRVHGIQGLRVADTSVIPVPVTGMLNAAAVVTGERTADFVLQDNL